MLDEDQVEVLRTGKKFSVLEETTKEDGLRQAATCTFPREGSTTNDGWRRADTWAALDTRSESEGSGTDDSVDDGWRKAEPWAPLEKNGWTTNDAWRRVVIAQPPLPETAGAVACQQLVAVAPAAFQRRRSGQGLCGFMPPGC